MHCYGLRRDAVKKQIFVVVFLTFFSKVIEIEIYFTFGYKTIQLTNRL